MRFEKWSSRWGGCDRVSVARAQSLAELAAMRSIGAGAISGGDGQPSIFQRPKRSRKTGAAPFAEQKEGDA